MCKFCDRFWRRFWEKSDAWEWEHSNESYLASNESERSRELIAQATAIEESDPAAALRLYVEAAESGSAWSLVKVGWHYQTGTAVAADLNEALEYYHRAICTGSWMATIFYARLLAKEGHHDESQQVLKDGVASDFVPAYFWLARLRYNQCKTRKVRDEIRPLLDYAACRGHPGARLTLARWKLLGKFGLREVLGGLKLSLKLAADAPNMLGAV